MSQSSAPSAGTTPGKCPNCNGDTYYEPMLTGGTAYQVRNGLTSGYACHECDWHEPPQTVQESSTAACETCGTETPTDILADTGGNCVDCEHQRSLHRRHYPPRLTNRNAQYRFPHH